MSKVSLKLPHQSEPVVVDCQLDGERFAITVDDTVYEGTVSVTGPGEGWLRYNGQIFPFYMIQKQEALSIWVQGKTYQVDLVSAAGRRGGGASSLASDGEIKAPMPGTVLKVPVKVGDVVTENQALIIMESMKMEMTLAAPHAGTVKAVQCQEGQLVEMGALLVRIETG